MAIAGAGPAGAALAVRLARAGARVAVLDAGAFPRPKLCGEFLSPEGGAALERLGLGADLARLGGEPIRTARITTPRGRVIEAEVVGPDGRPGLGLSRSALDDRLVAAARAAGAEVVERARVGGPLWDDGRVVGLTARRAGAGPIAVRARVVVAADGRRSALVRQTGRTRPRGGWLRPRLFGLERHLVAPADAEPPGVVGLHLVGGGYVGTCRVEGGLTNLCGLLPEAALRRHRGDLDRLAADRFGRNPALARLWAAAEPAAPWKAVAGVRVEASRPTVPGILYVGDGRGTVDPLGGQGMTMALLGAERLAPFALRAIAAGADAALQRAAEADWHARFDRRIRLCRAFHHLLVRPALIDAASSSRSLASRLLAAGYRWTRDPEPAGC